MARKQGLVAAFEEEIAEQLAAAATVEPEAGTVDLLDTLETGDTLEGAVAELTEVDGQAEDQLDGIDNSLADGETLEGIQDVMESSVETGGLDETAAQIAEIAIESIRKNLGMSKRVKMPAMESFGAKGDRVPATKLAMEQVSEMLKTVWLAVKVAFGKLSAIVVDFVKRLFVANDRAKARSAKMRAALAAIKDRTPSSETVDAGSFGAALATAEGASVSNITTAYATLVDYAKGNKASLVNVGEYLAKSSHVVDAVKTKEAFDAFDIIIKNLAGFEAAAEGDGFGKAPEGTYFAASKELPGGVALVQTVASAPEAGAKALASLAVANLEVKAIKGGAKEAKELKTLSSDEIAKLLDLTDELTKAVDDTKSALDALVEGRKKFEADVATLAGVDEEGAEERTKTVKGAVTSLNKFSTQAAKAVNGYAASTASKLLDYVGASISAYAAKKEAAKAE